MPKLLRYPSLHQTNKMYFGDLEEVDLCRFVHTGLIIFRHNCSILKYRVDVRKELSSNIRP
jgi:hypothetical protein